MLRTAGGAEGSKLVPQFAFALEYVLSGCTQELTRKPLGLSEEAPCGWGSTLAPGGAGNGLV